MTPNLLFIILPLLDFSISLSISLFLYYIALPASLHKKLSRLVSISNKAGICTHVYPFFSYTVIKIDSATFFKKDPI